MNSKLSAVVVAAGGSSRFQKSCHTESSKQLIEWDGKPLFIHTLQALSQLPLSEIALVIRPEEEEVIHKYLRSFSSSASISVCFGGKRRQDSVRNGLEALRPSDRVLVHDGARPFLSEEFLKRLVAQSMDFDGLIPVLPVFETLKEVENTGRVVKTYDRSKFVRVQTPQIFKYSVILEAHQELRDCELEFTDDAAIFEHLGLTVQTCEGDPSNIKVTVIEDLRLKNIHAG
jgi:2-C-methyl-D-erythritol 4-phosphate cytidylyltransferase